MTTSPSSSVSNTASISADLLPCPFCGSPAGETKPHDSLHTSWSVSCSRQYYNGCLGNGPMRETRKLAEVAWNTRPTSSASTLTPDALEGVRALVAKWRSDADWHKTHVLGIETVAITKLDCADELEAALNSTNDQPASGLDGNVKQRTGEGT